MTSTRILDTKDVDAYLLRLARFRRLGGLGCPWDLRTIALHKESEISARAHAVPGSKHHDASLEGRSVDRLDAGRLADDILAGVPLPPPGLSAHPELLPIGVHLREPHGLLLFWPGRLHDDRRRLLWWRVSWRNDRLSRWVRLRPARLRPTRL